MQMEEGTEGNEGNEEGKTAQASLRDAVRLLAAHVD